jgi:hypothetical protein
MLMVEPIHRIIVKLRVMMGMKRQQQWPRAQASAYIKY